MTVLLTSFHRWHQGGQDLMRLHGLQPERARAFSVAVYQPDGQWLPTMRTFDIRDPNGDWIRPRNHVKEGYSDRDVLESYHAKLFGIYWSRSNDPAIAPLFDPSYDVALCCWCPYDRAAQRQLEEFGSFVCHTWPIESVLERWGVETVRDADRERMVRSG